MRSPLSRHHATEGRWMEVWHLSQYAHKPGWKPETPCHIAAPPCLLSTSLPVSLFAQRKTTTKYLFFLMSRVSTHQISTCYIPHTTTWQFLPSLSIAINLANLSASLCFLVFPLSLAVLATSLRFCLLSPCLSMAGHQAVSRSLFLPSARSFLSFLPFS